MRDPKRIDYILKRVRYIWQKNPDMRLLQILISASCLTGTDVNKYLFVLEDDDLAKELDKVIRLMQPAEESSRSFG